MTQYPIGLILGVHRNNSDEFVAISRVTSSWHLDNPKGVEAFIRECLKSKLPGSNEPAFTKVWWVEITIP